MNIALLIVDDMRDVWTLATWLSEKARLPIACTGTWVKDGKRFSITHDDLKNIVLNFQRSKKPDVVCDYEHASEQPGIANGGPVPASGWITALEVSGGTLYADVDWNDDAAELIHQRKYRYVSPAIDWGAKDKETGDAIGARLTSLALTNHPFLEELPSLMLSDVELADGDKSDKVIHVPIPQGDGDMKIKVKVQKSDKDDDEAKLSDEQKLDELSEQYGEVQRAEDTDATHAKVGSGDSVSRSDFAYVGDPDKKSTWKFPIHNASHVRNALARWGQSKGIPADKKAGVLAKIMRAAKKFGVKVDKGNEKYKVAASDAEANGMAVWFQDISIDQQRQLVSDAIYRKFSGPGAPIMPTVAAGPWVKEIFDDHAIVESGGKLYRVNYTMDGDQVDVAEDPMPVKLKYVKATETKTMADTELKEKGTPEEVCDRTMSDGVKDDKDIQAELKKEAEKRAKDRGGAEEDEEEAILTALADDASPMTLKSKRLRMRAAKGDKAKRHAVLDEHGKLLGYVTHGDLMEHAGRYRKTDTEASGAKSKPEINTRLSEAIQDLTGKSISLSDVVKSINFASENEQAVTEHKARQESIKLVLSECFPDNAAFSTKSFDRLWADDKISKKDYFAFKWAVEEVNKAIGSGQFIPRLRKTLTRLALSDHDAFAELCKAQPSVVDYNSRGVSGNGMEFSMKNVDQELEERVKQRMTESKEDRATAMQKVLMSDSDLARRYRKEHTATSVQ